METYTKTIYLRRKNTSRKRPEWFHTESSKKLSATWVKNGDILRALTYAEEAEYMPHVLGTSSSASDFGERCRDYWKDISIPVPAGEGLKLDIEYRKEDDKPVVNASNITKYIQYKFALANNKCANEESELLYNKKAIFYLFDPEAKEDQEQKLADAKTDAMKTYLMVSDDMERIDQILTIMDHNTDDLNVKQKKALILKKFEDDPIRFKSVATDEAREMKYFITMLHRYSIVNMEGSDYIDGNKNYGNMSRFINFLRSPENSTVYTSYHSKLQALRKETSSMPPISPVAPDDANVTDTNPFVGDGANSVSKKASETNASKGKESKETNSKPSTQSTSTK